MPISLRSVAGAAAGNGMHRMLGAGVGKAFGAVVGHQDAGGGAVGAGAGVDFAEASEKLSFFVVLSLPEKIEQSLPLLILKSD